MITTVQQGAKFGTLEGKEYPTTVERPWKDRIHVFLIESNQMRMIETVSDSRGSPSFL
jgi:hypothetical protein